MTGTFARSGRSGECVLSRCGTSIKLGDLVYLWHGLERQTVCLACAKSRWGYAPTDAAPSSPAASSRERIGFDSTKEILRSLQAKVNARDPKLKQSGGDR